MSPNNSLSAQVESWLRLPRSSSNFQQFIHFFRYQKCWKISDFFFIFFFSGSLGTASVQRQTQWSDFGTKHNDGIWFVMKIFKDPYLKHLSAAFLLLHIQMISQKGVCWSATQIMNLGSTLLGSSISTPENIYGNLQLFAVFLCEGQFLKCHLIFFPMSYPKCQNHLRL